MTGKQQPPVTQECDIVQLVEKHHATIYAYAYRLSGRPEDAEDLAQQTFLIAQQKLNQLRDWEKAFSWLCQILRSVFLRSRSRKRPFREADLDCEVIEFIPSMEVDDLVDLELMQTALNRVSDDFRTILLMFYFEGLSYKQIAEELQIPAGTVMSRLARAKAMLREKMTSQQIGI